MDEKVIERDKIKLQECINKGIKLLIIGDNDPFENIKTFI